MRCCGGNKVFVGTLKHSHITSLLILGDRVASRHGNRDLAEARGKTRISMPWREKHTHTYTHIRMENVLEQEKKFTSGHNDPQTHCVQEGDEAKNHMHKQETLTGKHVLDVAGCR